MSLPQVVYHAVMNPEFAAKLSRSPRRALAETGFTLNPQELAALQKVLRATSYLRDEIPLEPLPPWRPEEIEDYLNSV